MKPVREYFSEAVLHYEIDSPRGCTVVCPETGTRIRARFSPYAGTSMSFEGGIAAGRTIYLSGVDGDRINEMADLVMTALKAQAQEQHPADRWQLEYLDYTKV